MRDTDDLPWDPLWAYVLGEGEGEEDRKGVFRRKKKTGHKGEGIMSYIKDVLPATESRDDKTTSNEHSENNDANEGAKKNGFAWRRNSKVVDSEPDDEWRWQISLGNSYDDEVAPATACRTNISIPLGDGPMSKERRNSLFRRHDTSTTDTPKSVSPSSERTNSIQRRNSRSLEAKSTESWEWGLRTGSDHDDLISSILPPILESSQAKPRRSSTFGSAFRKKPDNDSWDWQLSNGKKEKRGFGRRSSNDRETESRRVRFTKSSGSKGSSEWIDTKEVVAQIERSQTSLFDWVGINPSFEEGESAQKVGRRSSFDRSQKRDAPLDSGDLFAGLFSWDGSSEGDESSFQSYTDESSVGTLGDGTLGDETACSDDDTRSLPPSTNVRNVIQSREVDVESHSLDHSQDLNEVLLSFQPVSQCALDAGKLPQIDEEMSRTELPMVLTRDCNAADFATFQAVSPDSEIDLQPNRTDVEGDFDGNVWGSIEQSRSVGRGMCCSVKNLSSEQLKWSAESGIPFHELSLDEQSRLFPKKRAISDQGQLAPLSTIGNRQLSNNSEHFGNHHMVPMTSPQSLLEYEYTTGINMYLSYDRFGDNFLTVVTAPTPEVKSHDKNKSQNEMLVMVEASTVSSTDCAIRQGLWWGSTKPSLPNTPGVDIVGRVYRVDAETNKNYGWDVGDRIISLVKWGGNARYVSLDPSHAVAAPEIIDPATAVCLAETYLAAFQSLHLSQANDLRYRIDSLEGKSILLRGFSVSSMSHAIAQLAANAGATSVFAVAKIKHFNYLRSLGISPLNADGKDWLKALLGKIDLIISSDDDDVSIPYKLLKHSGNVITLKKFGSSTIDKTSKVKKGMNIRGRFSKIPRNRILSYDLYEQWDANLNGCKLDLQHLLQLLEDKKIEPTVLDRISLNKVADAQDLVRSKRLSGFVVCEPWLVGKSRTICL